MNTIFIIIGMVFASVMAFIGGYTMGARFNQKCTHSGITLTTNKDFYVNCISITYDKDGKMIIEPNPNCEDSVLKQEPNEEWPPMVLDTTGVIFQN